MIEHKCPYGGIWGWRPADYFREPSHAHVLETFFDCGICGGLCNRCQEDRADARAALDRKAAGAWAQIIADKLILLVEATNV